MRSTSLFLLLSFNAFVLLEAYDITDETDRQALFEFKSQVSEDKRVVLSSWNNSFPLCNWNGVTCGRKNKRVTRLDLGGLQLGGAISPSIGNLSFLISLNLTNNSFGGTIPHEVGSLFRLQHLNMSFNFLEGEIPASLSNCSRLLDLGLYSNHLGGSVPSELGSLNQLSSAGVRGTIGYAAPEYGTGGQPSIHGDVYSFGVLLLEMFTGKRPTNAMFGGNVTLHSYTKSALPKRVLDIADNSILQSGLRVGFPIVECLTLLLDVGLRCCEESPTNRLETSVASKELILIRERFFKARRTARR